MPSLSNAAAYVTEFNANGDVEHSTYFGGFGGVTYGTSIARNAAGDVYVAGGTTSANLPGAPPITPNPTAGFVSKLSSGLNTLQYTTLLGAEVDALSIFQQASPYFKTYPQVYAAGVRFVGTTDTAAKDAFVAKLDEGVGLKTQ
jgi:hypothetical protein